MAHPVDSVRIAPCCPNTPFKKQSVKTESKEILTIFVLNKQ